MLMDENQSVGVVGWFKAHSTIIFIVVVGLIAGVAFLKRNPSSGGTTPSSIDTTGLQKDANGVPIIYRDVADTFINVSVNPNDAHPVSSAPPTSPGGEHPIEPTPSGGTTTSNTTTSSNTNGTGGTYGILGPNVKVDFAKFTYNGGLPIPAPKGSKLVQGDRERVWVIYPNATTQDLLTSGSGPASKYLTYPIGAPFIPA